MKYYLRLTFFFSLLFFCFVISDVANAQFDSYVTHDYSYSEEELVKYDCNKWDKIRTIYLCGSGSDVCVNGAVGGYQDCASCGGSGASYASLYRNLCDGTKYWCDNLPKYAVWDWRWEDVDKTGDTCHYVKSVTSYGACDADTGTQCASVVTWNTWTREGTIADSECNNAVTLCHNCGVCNNSVSGVTTFEDATDISSYSPVSTVCKWGTVKAGSITYPDSANEYWNWKCVRDGVDSGTCVGLNEYEDIGLRIYDGSNTLKIAAEKKTCVSPYRIYKGGKVRCLGLLPLSATSHTAATDARIRIVDDKGDEVTKIIRKIP
jgi:hypothetical protein